VSSPEEVMEVIDEGKANRHVAVTSKCYRFCRFVYLSPAICGIRADPLFCFTKILNVAASFAVVCIILDR